MTKRSITKDVLINALANYGEALPSSVLLNEYTTLNIDSRTIDAGEIFLAIKGDLNDGHRFIANVITKNPALIIADASQKDEFKNVGKIVFVDDTLRFLGEVARVHLSNLKITKIGITGSNGKTTTKEMIKAALAHIAGEQHVYASAGNKNNLFGLPLCALEITEQHRYAIFEMGMNQVGEMARLCAIATPDLAVITNISGAHAGNFVDGVDGIRTEKGQIYHSIARSFGHAIINLDDDNCLRAASDLPFASRTGFARSSPADVMITEINNFSLKAGAQIVTMHVDNRDIDVAVPLAGVHHAMNAACAIAVIKALNLPVEKAAVGIKDMAKIAGRMSVLENNAGHLIIDDGYNANPVSMNAGIMASKQFPSAQRIAVIGAMGELGHDAAHQHFLLGEILAHNFDHIFLCGEDTEHTMKGAQKAGMPDDKIVFRKNSHELIEPIKLIAKRGDLLFIKGSLSSNMQVIAKALS